MPRHSDRAVALFEQGYNCAQATLAAFASDFELDDSLVVRLVAGLGAGRGGRRDTCGPVVAMALVAGLAAGASDPNDLDAKKALYARIREMEAEFVRVHGTTCCRELLEQAGITAGPEPSARSPEYYAARPCARFIATATAIASRTLEEAMGGGGPDPSG